MKIWVDRHRKTLKVFDEVDKFPEDDPRRLAILEPFSVKLLLKSDDGPLIAKHFPKLEQFIILRRNTSSKIPRDQAGEKFCELRDLIKPHRMLTRLVRRRDEEAAEFEWIHRDAAR